MLFNDAVNCYDYAASAHICKMAATPATINAGSRHAE
jgi:hypothetical protein